MSDLNFKISIHRSILNLDLRYSVCKRTDYKQLLLLTTETKIKSGQSLQCRLLFLSTIKKNDFRPTAGEFSFSGKIKTQGYVGP